MANKESSKSDSIIATILAIIFGIAALIYTVIVAPIFCLYIAYMVYISEPFEKDLLKDSDGYFIASLADANNWAFHAKYADKHVILTDDFLVASLPPKSSEQWKILEISGIQPGGFIAFPASDYAELMNTIAANAKVYEKNELIKNKDVNYNPADLGSVDNMERLIIDRFIIDTSSPQDTWMKQFNECTLEHPCHAAMRGITMPENFFMRGVVYAWSFRDKYLVRDISWKRISVKKAERNSRGS